MKISLFVFPFALFCAGSIAIAEECKGDNELMERCVAKLLKSIGSGNSTSGTALRIATSALVALEDDNGIANLLRIKSWKKNDPQAKVGCCDEGENEFKHILSLAATVNSISINLALLESLDFRDAGSEGGPFSEVIQLPDWEASQPDLNCPAAQILIHNRNPEDVKFAITQFITKGKYHSMTLIEKVVLCRIWLRINMYATREARGLVELNDLRRQLKSQLKDPVEKVGYENVIDFIALVEKTVYPELDKFKRDEEYRKQRKEKLEE